jgi:hypothetical protein
MLKSVAAARARHPEVEIEREVIAVGTGQALLDASHRGHHGRRPLAWSQRADRDRPGARSATTCSTTHVTRCPVSRVPCPVSGVPCPVSRVPCPVSGVPCPVSRVCTHACSVLLTGLCDR